MYADDTVIVCSDTDVKKAVENTGLAFKSVEQWCVHNKRAINT